MTMTGLLSSASDLASGELAQTGANGQMALIIAGVAIAVLVIGGIVLFLVRRRNRTPRG